MTQHRIALVTDSTCDLPRGMREHYGIHVVPLSIVWGDEVLREGVDIQPEDFYRRLVADPTYPTTTQPTPKAFVDVYEAAQVQGAEEIVVITISGAMSGTHESARLASTMVDIPVHLVDSKSNSMSLGWQLLVLSDMAGGSLPAR